MKKIYVTEVCKVDWDALPQDPTGHSMAKNPWAHTKTLADSFYNDELLSCLISSPGWLLVTLVHKTQWHHQSKHWRSGPRHPCAVSAQKNITVKADTRSNIYSHIQTELNDSKTENSPNFSICTSSTVYRPPGSHQYSLHWSMEVRPRTSFSTVWCPHRRSLLCKHTHTHSHIYSHIKTELNNSKIENSPNFEYKYLTALSTGSKKSSVRPPQSRVCSAVAPHWQSTPDIFWARQCWKM